MRRLDHISAVQDAISAANPGGKAVTAGAVVSEVWAIFVSADFIVYTLFPSLIGAAIHTIMRASSPEGELTVLDILIVLAIALAMGIYAGPWVAQIMPASREGLPLFCFLASLWAKDFGSWIKSFAESAIKTLAKGFSDGDK